MTPEQTDLVVIGMGIGGEAVAGPLAEQGWSVVGIEAGLVGGECPYWGCIPSKMMIRAANLLAEAGRIDGFAGEAVVRSDWAPVAERIRQQATDTWDDTVAVDRFVGKGGTFVRGKAHIDAPGLVSVGDRTFEATKGIVIATGTYPAVPPIPGLDTVPYWTNREAIAAEAVPQSIIVLGAGAIGTELSQVFSRFGADVTLVEALDRVLPLEEPEASSTIAAALTAEGIEVEVGVRATRVEGDGRKVVVHLDDGRQLSAERLLVATGRATDLAALGAGNVGIATDRRFVEVDAHMRAADGVWAVGDITGVALFTHIAAYQAPIAVASIRGDVDAPRADYRAVPRVTFSDPEVGSVGLSEAAARERGIDVATAIAHVPSTARGWLHGVGNDGIVKLVADEARGVLVGATSVGPHGGEVLGMLALAVHAEVPLDRMRSMIYAYPTFHRGVEDALREL